MQQPTARQTDADTLAQQHQLGIWRETYELYSTSCCFFILIPIILIIFVVFPLILLFTVVRPQLPLSFSISLIPSLFLLVFAGCALFGVIKIIISLLVAHQKRDSALLLYTNGLVLLQYQDKQLISSDALHWQDVELIWHNIRQVQSGGENSTTKTVHIYRLQSKQGVMFGGDSFEFNWVKLGKIVEQDTLPYLLPPTLDSYQRGLPLKFGIITLGSAGIDFGRQHLSWQDMKNIRFDHQGKIIIKQHSDNLLSSWAKISDQDVPNIQLLNALLTSIRDQQGPTPFSLTNKRYG